MPNSWIESANAATCDFPLANLPYGVFSVDGGPRRCGIAIGDQILDATAAEAAGLLRAGLRPVLDRPAWNGFMALGPRAWVDMRAELKALLVRDGPRRDAVAPLLVPMTRAELHMPFDIAEFTDFYAGRHHATHVGSMFRGAKNALPPNWLHMPIGYNGRASSVVVSGTPVHRPYGQLRAAGEDAPRFAPSERFDFELELGAIVGVASDGPLTVDQADAHIFGHVLLNDWSARDIQAWEYQPLGPFQSKATATSISPWIVPAEALRPFRHPPPPRDVPLLPYLADTGPMFPDIDLSVALCPAGGAEETISRTNARQLYYAPAQQLTHHASSGCPMNIGDLLGSGTISGPTREEAGCLLERTWGGQEPLHLEGGATRSFLSDGDTVILRGHAQGDGYRIGFGECIGEVLPAGDFPA